MLTQYVYNQEDVCLVLRDNTLHNRATTIDLEKENGSLVSYVYRVV
jgi:hypothetical protein